MPFVARYASGICPKCERAMNPGELLTVQGKGRPSKNGRGQRTYLHAVCAGKAERPVKSIPPAIQRQALEPSVKLTLDPRTAVIQEIVSQVSASLKPEFDTMYSRIENVERKAVRSLVVTINNGDKVHTLDVGVQHEKFETLLRLASGLEPAERNVWLTGPAGSGKTTAAKKLAEAFGVPFYFTGAIDSPYKLTGFVDAGGGYKETPYYRAVKHGGVFLFDEVDGSSPAALLEFQAFLATGLATFPNEPLPVERHPDCYVIAAANTWGFGGDANYVGRAKLDAAFLDRFVTLAWGYDEKLERTLAGYDAWVNVVVAVRKAAMDNGAQIVISPRASMRGAQLLKAGMSATETVEAVFGRYRGHNSWPIIGSAAERFILSH